jgi:protein-S-isoprenylcysteine O-methyltransferase Ste14
MPGLTLALGFAAGWIPLYVFRAETRRHALPLYTPNERLWVGLSPITVALHVSAACLTLSLTPTVAVWRALLAATLFAAGVGFWLWARAIIAPFGVRRLPDEPPPALRKDGPFGLVRNPLYLGVLVAAAAPAVAAGRLFLIATYLPCVVALAIRAAQDEKRLHAQLGEAYAQYCREVRRLFPFVW